MTWEGKASDCVCDEPHWIWGGTCCGTCGRRWKGLKESHCTLCHHHFYNVHSFDAHMSINGCRPESEWQGSKKGKNDRETLRLTETEYGAIWRWLPSN